MAGELPNSFLKRQLGIAPGAPASGPVTSRLFPVIDRIDSAFGALAVVAATVSLPIAAGVYALVVGGCLHLALSALTFKLGGKARAA
jgi:CDP-2,3-bis-(O-geranylgeranyl)-sn-glycerol synthase